ncbi:P63C domain-containing protein [Xenorhabdus ehlersii]|nr:P63C domain-containing protein [Xenorhabdus ehlersii]
MKSKEGQEMNGSRKIQYKGSLDLAGFNISCYVLKDGTRILSGREMQKALKLVDEETSYQVSGDRLQRYLNQKSLAPFIYKDKSETHYEPIICYEGEKKINGYEASILVDLCDSFMQARKEITLSARQSIIAEQCEMLIRSFAKVGIISLIDEATGYQYDRERDELQKILQAYVSDEILKWQLTFTDEFYKEIFRLWNYPYTSNNIKKKPKFIGKLTNKYIYEILPDGVFNALKDNTPKTENGNYKHRFHQILTPEIGREHLKKQITEVTTLMKISDNKEQFNSLFKKRYNTDPQCELELVFKEEIKLKSKISKNLDLPL